MVSHTSSAQDDMLNSLTINTTLKTQNAKEFQILEIYANIQR